MAANNVQVRLSAEDAGMVRAWLEAKRGVSEFSQELDRAGQKGGRAGKQVKDGFGSDMIGKIVSATAAIAMMRQGISAAGEAWTEYMKRQTDALASARSVDQGSRKLAQIAAGDSDKLQSLLTQRDTLSMKYGRDRSEMADAIFNAQSAGLTDAELEKAIQGTLVGDEAPQATKFMGAVKQIYKGKVDPQAAYNVAFQAQAQAANLEMKDVTQGLPELMNPADVLGVGLEDTAAIFTETAAHYSGGAETATAYKRLLAKLSMDKRFAGRGMEGLQEFVNMPEDKWEDIIGKDSEPRAAARNLKAEFEDIKKTGVAFRGVAAATGGKGDVINQAAQAQLAIPANAAALKMNQKERALEVENERAFAETEAARQAAVVDEKRRLLKEKEGFTGHWGSTAFRGAAEGLGFGPEGIERAGKFGQTYGRAFQDFGKNISYIDASISRGLGLAPTDKERSTLEERENTGAMIVDELKGLRADLQNGTIKVKPEADGAGAVRGGVAAPGLGDR